MGAKPYWYFFEYQLDINSALQSLRQREFEAGRYFPVMDLFFPVYPINENSPAPGAKHPSIDSAREDAAEEGTHSILDIDRVSEVPESCATTPLSTDELISLLGTDKPTHELIESILIGEEELDFWEETGFDVYESFWDTIQRGECRHIFAYRGEEPTEIFFVGFSFD